MKCPVCQAKLMPVDGQMFCLQCGEITAPQAGGDNSGPPLEDTSDPVLQRAIVDAVQHDVAFRLPVSQASPAPPKTSAFTSMRTILASPRPALVGTAPSTVGVAPLAPEVVAEPNEPVSDKTAEPVKKAQHNVQRRLSLAWSSGIGVFVLFLAVNLGIYSYYSQRVYPGVKAGNIALGGLPYDRVHGVLAQHLQKDQLKVEMNGATYKFGASNLGSADIDRIEREVRELGHTTPLPIAGLTRALLSKPVSTEANLNGEEVHALALQLSRAAAFKAHDAVPLIVSGQAFVIAERSGSELELSKAESAIRLAYSSDSAVHVAPSRLSPVVSAAAYTNDVSEAQARMALSLQIKRKAASYNPTPQQIGSWLVFQGPGKGVKADAASVAAYIASIPGSFDRVAATNALVGAVDSKQNLTYTVVTKSPKANPVLASTKPVAPVTTYNYCLNEASNSEGLSKTSAQTLAAGGWTLGGVIAFARVEDGCNFELKLTSVETMKATGAACDQKASCLSGNVLAFASSAWEAAPSGWKSGIDAYRSELINHEVGHWLGFDHASCTMASKDQPLLQAPTVVLSGCSPNWYVVPFELQPTKAYGQL